MNQAEINEVLSSSPSISILRERNSILIIDFFTSVFSQHNKLSMENIHGKLAEYLYNNDEEEEEDTEGDLITDTFEEKAKKLIRKWVDKKYLMTYKSDEGEIYYELTSWIIKTIEWIPKLKKEEYIGTESKFRSIITQTRELVEYSEGNAEKRISLLEEKIKEYQNQIEEIKNGGNLKVYETVEIGQQYKNIEALGKEFVVDIKDVGENLSNIIREIYQKSYNLEIDKNEVLSYAFDCWKILRESPQGKSFFFFWSLLSSNKKKIEVEMLFSKMNAIGIEKNICNNDYFLRDLIQHIYDASLDVKKKVGRMVEKVKNIICENSFSERSREIQLINDTEALLLEGLKHDVFPNVGLSIIEKRLDINIPFDRMLTYPRSEKKISDETPIHNVLERTEEDLKKKAYGEKCLTENEIVLHIQMAAQKSGQTTLGEVISLFPLKGGLEELFEYLPIIHKYNKIPVEEEKECVLLNEEKKRYIYLPKVILVL